MPASRLLPRNRRRLLAGAALALTLGWAQAQTSALQAPGPSADRVKAAFILKFFNYVEWPAAAFATPGAPYVIGVQGDDAVLAELQRQGAGRRFNHRAVVVRAVEGDEVPAGLQLLFIGERARIEPLLRAVHGSPVLVVTDAAGALDLGSMINFRLVDDRVRFEVALGPVRNADLLINSRLLSVAIAVNKGTGQ
ncbi:hypothetical protein GCM10027321_37470 [Massilia terrae]|uniref:YfiR family protein n=1 Tax=Massilia terrae TaxID=1811224 RepID=A0ABT2CZM8_9BURK|nr:YfiR family protein [Massilia terrae]MCS0659329.1 YfiR family protein [Massilia terrae]